MRHHSPGKIALWATVFLSLAACQAGPSPSSPVALVVFDAGETLGLLPVAARLRSTGTEVMWIPLTPWAADLLTVNGSHSTRSRMVCQECLMCRTGIPDPTWGTGKKC